MKTFKSLFVGALVVVLSTAHVALAQNAKSGGKDKAPAAAPAAPAAPQAAAGPAPGPGQYKIGVVNRKEVFKGYKKVKSEYENLQKEVAELQKPIDTLSDKVQKAKEAYEKEQSKLTPDERNKRELEIKTMYNEYTSLLEKNQKLIDAKEASVIKSAMGEIDAAVAKLGERENYHIILEGSGSATAIFYSPTIDVSQKVVDILNNEK